MENNPAETEVRSTNPLDFSIDKEGEKKLFNKLAGVEGLSSYLRDTMGMDILRHFSVGTDKERDSIMGHYSFAKYLYNNLIKAKKDSQAEELDK